ncbi:MAG TPA: DUF1990 domain-containing protein [Acidobacteriaceae bacterium]|jgi:uncharacterized protein (UPF0548 family)|nr:DUF1990 domain-containing protein [Acidobacteriaceae bacterium]
MFSLRRPAESSIRRNLEIARTTPGSYGVAFDTQYGPEDLHVPPGYVRGHMRTQIGRGREAFEAARAAFRQWKQFDVGWVRVANPEVPVEQEEIVAVEAHTFGLWSVNYSRILYVIDEPGRFGFGYGTTPMHVERGEERFLIEYYPVSGEVYYDLLAVSQPAHWLVKLAGLLARGKQRCFARESHAKMAQVVAEAVRNKIPARTPKQKGGTEMA